jgi:WhiB family redox-sensing transcriptional regulator
MSTQWQRDALCREFDPELFHPLPGQDPTPALFVCAACPVRAQCLAWALEIGVTGIWGGTNETQRRAIRRERRQAEPAPAATAQPAPADPPRAA